MGAVIASDFDGTIAQTFAPSPHGIGVNEACEQACQNIFGDRGIRIFRGLGGLNNNSPGTLVSQILLSDHASQPDLIKSARTYFRRHEGPLRDYVPADTGIPFLWDDDNPFPIITELFVRVKLRILMKEISGKGDAMWPKPCKGFLEFWRALSLFNRRHVSTGHAVDFRILSSGHDLFIKRAFKLWRIKPPQSMVTDDFLRSPECNLPPKERTKPHPATLRLLCKKELGEGNVVYAGDCLKKDGGLAASLKIPILWVKPDGVEIPSDTASLFGGGIAEMTDWTKLSDIFTPEKVALRAGGMSFPQVVLRSLR